MIALVWRCRSESRGLDRSSMGRIPFSELAEKWRAKRYQADWDGFIFLPPYFFAQVSHELTRWLLLRSLYFLWFQYLVLSRRLVWDNAPSS